MKESEKIRFLRQIRALLAQSNLPTLRDAGISEEVARELSEGRLIEVRFVADEGDFLDIHQIDRITRKGLGLLAQADHKEEKKPSALLKVGKWLVITFLVSIPSILVALNQFEPRIAINGVRTSDTKFESEARLELRNNGTFSLTQLKPTWHQVQMIIGGLHLNVRDSIEDGSSIARLSNGEPVFFPILPSTYTKQAAEVNECSYALKIRFRQQFLFFKGSEIERNWRVSLRKPGNAQTQWDISPIEPPSKR